MRFAEVSPHNPAPLSNHEESSDSGSGSGSAYDFENSRGINRAAYRVEGDSDTMSESSEDTFAEGPIDD